VAHETDLSAGGLHLAGYNLSRQAVPSGGQFDIDLAWEVEQTVAQSLQSNVWLRDAQGLVWSDRETFRPRVYEETVSTRQWQPGQWAWDSREVHVLSGAPPGRYEIVLTLFDLADLQPLTLVRGGDAVGPTAVIGQLDLVRPQEAPELRPQYELMQRLNGLRLLGFNQDRRQAAPGDPLLLTLFWEKPSEGAGDAAAPAELDLTLRDAAGEAWHRWTIPPVRQTYPPADWQPGERLRGQHLLRLPASLQSGAYRFWLEDVELGALSVDAPQRRYTEPSFDHAIDKTFGGVARLAGYSLQPADLDRLQGAAPPELRVRLVWQAREEMATSYRVFVHLVAASGEMIAQSDAEPAQWTRPTTGWAPGEYVIDEHVLALPEQSSGDAVTLRVGLFDPQTGERLTLPGDADYVLLEP
jgi:hypothetical protein